MHAAHADMDSNELRRWRANSDSQPPPTFSASQLASQPQPPASQFEQAAGRAPDQAQPAVAPAQAGAGAGAGTSPAGFEGSDGGAPGGAPPGDERLPLDYKARVVPSRGRGRRGRGGLLGMVKARR